MTSPLARSGEPASLARLICEKCLASNPDAVDFFEISEKAAETLGLCSTSSLRDGLITLDATPFCGKDGVDFSPLTFDALLTLSYESRTEGYRETAERVRCVERLIEQAVERIAVDTGGVTSSSGHVGCRASGCVRGRERARGRVTTKLCRVWSSIFHVEREGRPWRILEEQKAPRKDVSLIEKIEGTEAYQEAHRKMVGVIRERYLCLAEIVITKTDLDELEATKAGIEKGTTISPEFLTRLSIKKNSYSLLDKRGRALQKGVEVATRSREEAFLKEKVRITGVKAAEELWGKELGILSKAIEKAIKNIFNEKVVNSQIHQTRFDISFFKWGKKEGLLKEWAEEAFVALREGSPWEEEFPWIDASCEVRRAWEEFPHRLDDALGITLSSDKLFDKIKEKLVFNFESSKWNLTVSLETILASFLKQGFSEALEFVEEKGISQRQFDYRGALYTEVS